MTQLPSRSALRVLYLTTESPYPPTSGGRVRTFAQLGLLASMPEVERIVVVSLDEDGHDHVRKLRDVLGAKVATEPPVFHAIHLKQHKTFIPRVLWERAKGKPYLAGKWVSPALAARLEAIGRAERFDIIYVDHLGMAVYAPRLREIFPGARLILEQHNVESDFFQQFAARKRGAVKMVATLEHREARRFEQRAMRDADHTVAISAEDAARFVEMGAHAVTVVPQRVVLRVDPGAPRSPVSGEVLYVGNLGWGPNVAGLDWFFREVWPRVREVDASLNLRVCGSGLRRNAGGDLEIPSSWRADGVEVVGFVDDLREAYARASAIIAPIVGGSGVRIKLLEAMSYGVPVVTTTDGASGLPLVHGRELVVADTPATFATELCALARSPARGDALRAEAFAFLSREHSEAAAQARMRIALGIP
jgi:glycosyltransferase involved in cell wall biosynthesis